MSGSVTALVLCYNRSVFLSRALRSVGEQAFRDWRLVLSDCSDDPAKTAEIEAIFESFRERHPDKTCRLLRHPQRLRQHAHLTAALAAVETPYFALLDDDDFWMPDHLARAMEWLGEDPRRGLCIDNAEVVDAAGVPRGALHDAAKAIPPCDDRAALMEYFLRSFYGSTSGFVMRTGAAEGWPLPALPLVDVHLAFAAAANGAFCRCFRETGYAYREHGGSNYVKGRQVHRERHQWRLLLARRHGWSIFRRCPRFPLLCLKSLWFLALDRPGSKS